MISRDFSFSPPGHTPYMPNFEKGLKSHIPISELLKNYRKFFGKKISNISIVSYNVVIL